MAVAGFIEPRRALVDSGVLASFEEVETGAVTESFGKVAHRFSTYEKRGVRDGAAFAARGPDRDAVRPHARRLADHVDGMGRRGVSRSVCVRLRRCPRPRSLE